MNQDDALSMLQKINEINNLVVQLDLENKLLKKKIKDLEKPKKQQYRICLIHYKTGKYGIGVSQTNDEEDEVQSHDEFVCWLTDRVEYELPEEKV